MFGLSKCVACVLTRILLQGSAQSQDNWYCANDSGDGLVIAITSGMTPPTVVVLLQQKARQGKPAPHIGCLNKYGLGGFARVYLCFVVYSLVLGFPIALQLLPEVP